MHLQRNILIYLCANVGDTCEVFRLFKIPQTDLSVGVLAVLVVSRWSYLAAGRRVASLSCCKNQYKLNGTFKDS